jgi:hypothetical protein
MKECPTCGDEFENERGMKIHHSKVHNESLKGEEVECEWCGEDLVRQKSRAKTHCFCDHECHGEWKSENHTGKDNHIYKRVDLVCDQCGNEFSKPPSTVFERNFCSDDCRTTYMNSDKWCGENSPVWKGGSSVYSTGWAKRRKQVRKDRCEDCGMSNNEHLEEYDRKLEVHHIIPRRTFDDNEKADRDENLMTLCIPCHRKRDN